MIQIQKDFDMSHVILIQFLSLESSALAVILVVILLLFGLLAPCFPNTGLIGLVRSWCFVYLILRIFN